MLQKLSKARFFTRKPERVEGCGHTVENCMFHVFTVGVPGGLDVSNKLNMDLCGSFGSNRVTVFQRRRVKD